MVLIKLSKRESTHRVVKIPSPKFLVVILHVPLPSPRLPSPPLPPPPSPSLPQLAFKWFDTGMADLEHETHLYIFKMYMVKVDPSKLGTAGYHCLLNYFETINLAKRKLKKIGTSLVS